MMSGISPRTKSPASLRLATETVGLLHARTVSTLDRQRPYPDQQARFKPQQTLYA